MHVAAFWLSASTSFRSVRDTERQRREVIRIWLEALAELRICYARLLRHVQSGHDIPSLSLKASSCRDPDYRSRRTRQGLHTTNSNTIGGELLELNLIQHSRDIGVEIPQPLDLIQQPQSTGVDRDCSARVLLLRDDHTSVGSNLSNGLRDIDPPTILLESFETREICSRYVIAAFDGMARDKRIRQLRKLFPIPVVEPRHRTGHGTRVRHPSTDHDLCALPEHLRNAHASKVSVRVDWSELPVLKDLSGVDVLKPQIPRFSPALMAARTSSPLIHAAFTFPSKPFLRTISHTSRYKP